MPELPEVETVRRGLEPALEGAKIESVTLNRSGLRFPFQKDFAKSLVGARIISIERRAKYLLFRLAPRPSTGERRNEKGKTLLAHLGMSGRFRVEKGKSSIDPGLFYEEAVQNDKHDHVVITLSGGRRLIYNDARRFGFMEVLSEAEAASRFDGMGVEPLSAALNGKALQTRLEGKVIAIKPALLDQQVIAGIGNIYACEALWDAKVSPRAKAGSLKPLQYKALAASLKKVLKKAITLGGSTLRDFKDATGKSGSFQHQFCVYDRAGKPCPRCKHEIERFAQAGRSTFWCPNCQK